MGAKKIDNGKARVIIINEHALFELNNETIMDHLCVFFDLHDSKKVTLETQWHRETNSLIAVVYNRSEKRSVELNELREQIGATTSSMFSRKRYITIDL